MPYYHLLASLTDDDHWDLVVGDQSDEGMRCMYLEPLTKGKDTVVGNCIWRSAEIRRVMIVRTAEPVSDVLTKMRNEDVGTMRQEEGLLVMPAGFGTRESDIRHAGDDVTADFLTHGWPTKSQLYENQWVVGIGVTLIGGFILWKLGWK